MNLESSIGSEKCLNALEDNFWPKIQESLDLELNPMRGPQNASMRFKALLDTRFKIPDFQDFRS